MFQVHAHEYNYTRTEKFENKMDKLKKSGFFSQKLISYRSINSFDTLLVSFCIKSTRALAKRNAIRWINVLVSIQTKKNHHGGSNNNKKMEHVH